jgi:hypothetical protein
MATDGFTPARERARRVRIAEALRGGSMASPVWLLCPDASLRQELLAAVAARGGGFFRAVDWSMLAEGLDPRLGLPFAAPVDETERVLAVERTLFTRARGRDGLRESLAADPFGVASALLRVVDLLRAHGWRGEVPLVDARDPVSAVTAEHVDTLRALREALETQLSARGQLDLVGRPPPRLRRARRGSPQRGHRAHRRGRRPPRPDAARAAPRPARHGVPRRRRAVGAGLGGRAARRRRRARAHPARRAGERRARGRARAR